MFGVFINGWPMQLRQSHLWSSDSMKTMFGFFSLANKSVGKAWLARPAASAPPMVFMACLLVIGSLMILLLVFVIKGLLNL